MATAPQHQGRAPYEQGDRTMSFFGKEGKTYHWHAGGVRVEGSEYDCENPMAALHSQVHARMEKMASDA